MRALRFAFALLAAPMALANVPRAHAQAVVSASVLIPPPVLPIYAQPPLPAPGHLWTPGYWAYGDGGYYWVPGVWVQPPAMGLLWTPGYWAWADGAFVFNRGYWGPHVGFYGGINYGFGYGGVGYAGGQWHNGSFAYNHAVNNFGSVPVDNYYNQAVRGSRGGASFNGPNGINAHPSPREAAFGREPHVEPGAEQQRHFEAAAHEPSLRASANGGHPSVAAVTQPGVFHGPGVVAARGATSAARPGSRAPRPPPHAAPAGHEEQHHG